ncbi:MAG: hypothetical protein R3Y40_09055 [Eubacteriales bacterium]
MDYTDKIIRQSNYWYNDGLNRANFRDLSGAIISLRRSLQYCRQNIAARNLLGLVYYGRGEVNEALVEWIISKNLRPRDNVANYFIRKVQESPAALNKVNANVKKYNQCLLYCKQDAEDLAYIQIKKVVTSHPTFVKGYQLLALLCIQNGHYSKANQALKKAHKIDTTDAITLYFMNELAELKAAGKRSKEEKDSGVLYSVGNETIIQPTSASLKENASSLTMVNIVIGIIIGVAVMVFLIEPTLLENQALINADAIREYSQLLDTQEAENNALKTELETYRTTNDEAETVIANAGSTQTAYETLLSIQEAFENDSTSYNTLAESLREIQVDLLGEEAADLYEDLGSVIYVSTCEELYEQAVLDFEDKDYAAVITGLEEVMAMIESYESYEAMILLGQAYEKEDDTESAKTYYQLAISDGVGTSAADEAVILLNNLVSSTTDTEE